MAEVVFAQKPCVQGTIQTLIHSVRVPYPREVLDSVLEHGRDDGRRVRVAVEIASAIRVGSREHVPSLPVERGPALRQPLHGRLAGGAFRAVALARLALLAGAAGGLSVRLVALQVLSGARREARMASPRLQHGHRPQRVGGRRALQAAGERADACALGVQLGLPQDAQNLRVRVGLLAAQLGQDLVQLVVGVGVGGRRPVVQRVLAGHAVSVRGGALAQAAEAAHHASQAVALLDLVVLPLEQAQALSRPVQAHLVVLVGGVLGVVVGGGAQRGGQVEDVFVDGALELAQGRDEGTGGFRVLRRLRQCHASRYLQETYRRVGRRHPGARAQRGQQSGLGRGRRKSHGHRCSAVPCRGEGREGRSSRRTRKGVMLRPQRRRRRRRNMCETQRQTTWAASNGAV